MKADAETTARALEGFFARRPAGIAAAYLFGSVARGTSSERSDVDVGVLFVDAPAVTYDGLPLALEGELERVLGRRVQIVVLNSAPCDLVHRVLRDGRLVAELDRSKRVRFEVRSRSEYFDMEPVRRAYRRARVA